MGFIHGVVPGANLNHDGRMKITSVRSSNSTSAVRVDDSGYTPIPGFASVSELLSQPNWRELAEQAEGTAISSDEAEVVNPLPTPTKVLCVGLNYREHILEMGRELPAFPTVFAKFADTLTGPFDPIEAVAEDPQLDWEGELVVVIGKRAHRVSAAEASEYIAGYTVANDISMRGWQNRTNEWLQGKMWFRSTPVGPVIVTPDEFNPAEGTVLTRVNGETMQEDSTGDLVFGPADLVAYISTIVPLNPGDMILTGTPGGVGHARKPGIYLRPGDVVEVSIDGIGVVRNEIVEPAV